MATETTTDFAALETQAQTLMQVFERAGHEAVAPPIIQPADVFLDVIGETLRARTYVFTDADDTELCLRPDLTVPTCRLHIARNADAATAAKYCYNGTAFRFQPHDAAASHPREFRQTGIERFGDADKERAETETITLILNAVKAAGLNDWAIEIGDLGLFKSALAALDMPLRWQKELFGAFWQPEIFSAKLKRLTTNPAATAQELPKELVAKIVPHNITETSRALQAYFDANNIEVSGNRTVTEVAGRLLDIAADAQAFPLEIEKAKLIETYVTAKAPVTVASKKIGEVLRGLNGGTLAALDAFERRLQLLFEAGIPLDKINFTARFGRNIEYYSGLVFEVTCPQLDPGSPIAGGGRYDGLMRAAGADKDVAAVGGAIHTERLLSVVNGGRS